MTPNTPPTATGSPAPDPLLTPGDVSDYISIPEETLAQWRYRRIGPAWLKVGRHVRYQRTDLDAWLAAQRTATA